MDEEVGMKNERVDDIPLLLAQMERMGIVVDGRSYGESGDWSSVPFNMQGERKQVCSDE